MPTNLEALLAFLDRKPLMSHRLCSNGIDLYSYFTKIATWQGSKVRVLPGGEGETGTMKRHRQMLEQLLKRERRAENQSQDVDEEIRF